MKHNDDILIDRFLRGELTEDEQKDFQRLLEEKDGFSQKVKEMEEIRGGVRESVLQEKRELLTEFENEILSQDEKSVENEVSKTGPSDLKRRINMRRLWWIGAVAAMVIGVMMFLPEGEVKGPSEEYAYLFEPEEFEKTIEHEVKRSIKESNYSLNQRKAFNYYSLHEFEKAIPLLNSLWIDNKDSIALKYLGYSHLGIGNNEQALIILNKLNEKGFNN